MEDKYTPDFHVATGKYKKVVANDGHDYVQIYNDTESSNSFNTRIVVSDTRFNRTTEAILDLDEKSLKLLKFAMDQFFN